MQEDIETFFSDLEDKINKILEEFNSDERLLHVGTDYCNELHQLQASEMTFGRLGRACLNIIAELQQRSMQSEGKRSVSPWETDSVALSRSSIWAQTLWGNLTEALEALDESDLEKARRKIIVTANSLAAFAVCMERLEKAKDELKERFSTSA
jgi:hypothetical protein